MDLFDLSQVWIYIQTKIENVANTHTHTHTNMSKITFCMNQSTNISIASCKIKIYIHVELGMVLRALILIIRNIRLSVNK